jgi:enamine deaminase RidA (YjgF/YER057c/UK114 family)
MPNDSLKTAELLIDLERLSDGEREELLKLGIISRDADQILPPPQPACFEGEPLIRKRAIHAPEVLNEAYHYARPSSFSRGLRLDIGGVTVLLISGTASVNEEGKTSHVGDFRAQCWRTYRNITTLLKAENATWHDIIRTTCYLRDIERDYKDFNEIRTAFFSWHGLDPLPASVGVQSRLCREDLLVEIEAVALIQSNRAQ